MSLALKGECGVLDGDCTFKIQRRLPGTIDRVWAYLTQSELRRQWLAAGEMDGRAGSSFELVWRNGELSDRPSNKPEGFGDEHRLNSEITAFDPPRKLAFTWGNTGGVTFDLEPAGQGVLLTITHRRIEERSSQLNISAGWHAHLDVLESRLAGEEPEPFWDRWIALKAEYERRLAH